MNKIKKLLFIFGTLTFGLFMIFLSQELTKSSGEKILSHVVDLKTQELKFYWKDEEGHLFGNFERLKNALEEKNKHLIFAMNGGMFSVDQSPVGLYIEEGKLLHNLNTASLDSGNFYLKPNGVFYILKNGQAGILTTEAFQKLDLNEVNYATQSGPMLLVEGKMHPEFLKGSDNLNIRNGVGLLPDGSLIFAMSKKEINFYDFAMYFKNLGVQNALYLDGLISKTYLPEKDWEDVDGELGVIIAEAEK